MATGDCIVTIGEGITMNTWNFSRYGPEVTWSFLRDIVVFNFPGTTDRQILDLLDSEEVLTIDLKIVTEDVAARLNDQCSATASLKSFIDSVVTNGTDVASAPTKFKLTWHNFKEYLGSVKSIQLTQRAGEGDLYSLQIQLMVKSRSDIL